NEGRFQHHRTPLKGTTPPTLSRRHPLSTPIRQDMCGFQNSAANSPVRGIGRECPHQLIATGYGDFFGCILRYRLRRPIVHGCTHGRLEVSRCPTQFPIHTAEARACVLPTASVRLLLSRNLSRWSGISSTWSRSAGFPRSICPTVP